MNMAILEAEYAGPPDDFGTQAGVECGQSDAPNVILAEEDPEATQNAAMQEFENEFVPIGAPPAEDSASSRPETDLADTPDKDGAEKVSSTAGQLAVAITTEASPTAQIPRKPESNATLDVADTAPQGDLNPTETEIEDIGRKRPKDKDNDNQTVTGYDDEFYSGVTPEAGQETDTTPSTGGPSGPQPPNRRPPTGGGGEGGESDEEDESDEDQTGENPWFSRFEPQENTPDPYDKLVAGGKKPAGGQPEEGGYEMPKEEYLRWLEDIRQRQANPQDPAHATAGDDLAARLDAIRRDLPGERERAEVPVVQQPPEEASEGLEDDWVRYRPAETPQKFTPQQAAKEAQTILDAARAHNEAHPDRPISPKHVELMLGYIQTHTVPTEQESGPNIEPPTQIPALVLSKEEAQLIFADLDSKLKTLKDSGATPATMEEEFHKANELVEEVRRRTPDFQKEGLTTEQAFWMARALVARQLDPEDPIKNIADSIAHLERMARRPAPPSNND